MKLCPKCQQNEINDEEELCPDCKLAEIREKRKKQMEDYTEERDGVLYLKQDVQFKTPSGAAVFCIGGSANGWKEWVDENNKPLDTYRKL